jgi:hypothetical protein
MPALKKASWLALATVALSACSAGNGDPGGIGSGNAPGGGNAPGAGGVLFGSGGSTGNGGLPPATGGANIGSFTSKGGSGSGGVPGECASVSEEAEKILGGKADIIWAIDTSGSMIEELTAVQNNMNAFSTFILGTGIDVHVIAVAIGVRDFLGLPAPGLCIAPPLGSGASCFNAGDTRSPVYTHLDVYVDSHNALQQLIATYPQWQSAIRPDATKTFVVVTDDEANADPTPVAFKQFFDNAFAGSTWRFSGIYCRGPSSNCENPGNRYDELLTPSGGIWADLGAPTPDWNDVFKQLGDAVVADAKPVDCEWKIPPAPDGKTFEKEKVNVDFTPTSGVKETIFKVTKDTCQDPAGGWFFDNESAPTTVVACPQSCTKIQADNNAKIDIAFGCESKRPIM